MPAGMKIITLSVGRPRNVAYGGRQISTSIFKKAVHDSRAVSLTNIAGNEQADRAVHGDRDKAIYVYSEEYYPDWARHFGRPCEPSQFGENLTVSGGRDSDVVLGTRYRVGSIECVATQPRIPCHKLGIRVGDEQFPNHFWTTGRLGFYLRVEAPGSIQVGDEFSTLDTPEHGITVRRLHEILQNTDKAAAALALAHLPHLDSGWQRRLHQIG